jgi:hypothetical protein
VDAAWAGSNVFESALGARADPLDSTAKEE